jgi:hypothetical protein
MPLKAAHDNRRAECIRQTLKFLVENPLQFSPCRLASTFVWCHLYRSVFMLSFTCGRSLYLQGAAVRRTMQPICDGMSFAYGVSLEGQGQECGLECVLTILFVTQNALADGPYESAMAPHQARKGRIVTNGGESSEEVVVGNVV